MSLYLRPCLCVSSLWGCLQFTLDVYVRRLPDQQNIINMVQRESISCSAVREADYGWFLGVWLSNHINTRGHGPSKHWLRSKKAHRSCQCFVGERSARNFMAWITMPVICYWNQDQHLPQRAEVGYCHWRALAGLLWSVLHWNIKMRHAMRSSVIPNPFIAGPLFSILNPSRHLVRDNVVLIKTMAHSRFAL